MRKASQEVRLGFLTAVRVLSLDPGALAAVRWLAEERGRVVLYFQSENCNSAVPFGAAWK